MIALERRYTNLLFIAGVIVLFGGVGVCVGWSSVANLRAGRRRSSELTPRAKTTAITLVTGMFLAVGIGMPAAIFVNMKESLDSQHWTAQPCTVTDTWVTHSSARRGQTASGHALYEYSWKGRTYRSDRYSFMASLDPDDLSGQFAVGTTHTCYIDPADPYSAVLRRELGWSALLILFPIPFLLVGIMGGWELLTRRRHRRPFHRRA
jgi:hypothetical protein